MMFVFVLCDESSRDEERICNQMLWSCVFVFAFAQVVCEQCFVLSSNATLSVIILNPNISYSLYLS